jgi:uncharacterized protein (DUF697 family)
MAGITDVSNIWKNVRELDLRPIRESAEQGVEIVLAGAPGSGRHTLANQMRKDPARPEMETQSPVMISGLVGMEQVAQADLVILVLDMTAEDDPREQELARSLANAGKKVLVFANKLDLAPEGQLMRSWSGGKNVRFMAGSANDPASLLRQFVPAVMELLPDRLLALGRQFPLFRVPIAHSLINDTCFSNAAYALSTGIAAAVPVFDVPLNIADMVVLTKAQGFLVYKLGLVFGFSTRWQDYITEFGSVIGGGFVWRQLARFLVGLIPVWGIVPKVAVAYSGTYVVGNAVLQWYLTGRHLNRQQMRELSAQAFMRGKALARSLIEKAPRPRLRRGKKAAPLPLPPPPAQKACSRCGKGSAADAAFCQYCGQPLNGSEPAGEPRTEPSPGEPGGEGERGPELSSSS